ncbi:putative serine dehydratase domain-containing protein, partial [Jimgerdemannia flammicorona]
VILGIPISPDKLAEAHDLSRRIPRFHVLVDHISSLEAIEAYCVAREEEGEKNVKFSVWLKVDGGYSRAGVPPTNPSSLHLAQRLHTSPHTTFQGIYTHSGHSYSSTSPLESLEFLHQERDLSLSFRSTLLASGIPVPHISIGATPSVTSASQESSEDLRETSKSRWEGVTELHAGNFIFMDRQQIRTRAAIRGEADCAVTVLTRVLSMYPDRGTILVDAGALAMSKDSTMQGGYGQVLGTRGEDGEDGWTLTKISQEHGIMSGLRTAEEWEEVKVGEVMRVVPNHACLTAACFPFYVVVDGRGREATRGGVREREGQGEVEELVVVDMKWMVGMKGAS